MERYIGVLILSLSLLTLGCAPLQPHDSAWGDAAEIAGRTLLGIGTLGTNELMFKGQYKMEQDAKAHQQWYNSLTPEQQDRQDRREAAALQALGMALSSGGPMRSYTPVYQPPVMQPLPGNTPAPRQRFNCLSQQYGNQTLTNCQ